MELYHATFGKYKEDILENGLIGKRNNSTWFTENYNDFDMHPIFLAKDEHIAWSFIETSESSDELYKSGGVLFRIKKWDYNELMIDPIQYKDWEEIDIQDPYDVDNPKVTCCVYFKKIPASDLELIKKAKL